MKARMLKRIAVPSMMLAVAALSSGRAAEPTNLPVERVAKDPVVVPPRDQVISKPIIREKPEIIRPERANRPERPERPEVERLSRSAKESVEEIKSNFRAKADDYVRKQKEIVAELKTAKGEEKTKVREKLKDLKEQWKDEKPDVKEVVSDLKEKVEKEKEKGKDKGGGKPRD